MYQAVNQFNHPLMMGGGAGRGRRGGESRGEKDGCQKTESSAG